MSQEDPYDLKPEEKKVVPKPGEPGWVEPVPIIEKAEVPPPEEPADPDVTNNKAVALLGYILFLIPLVAAPQSKFARFHANQGLMVFILWCVAVVGVMVLEGGVWTAAWLLGRFGILVWFFSCLLHMLELGMLVGMVALTIMGIIRAANGEWKGLPLIGHWKLIK